MNELNDNEIRETEVDDKSSSDEVSRELDAFYDSYLEEGKSGKKRDAATEETDGNYHHYLDDAEKSPEKKAASKETEEELDEALDAKYQDYLEHGEQPEGIKCRNEKLEGTTHPETGVPFERRQVMVDGEPTEVVVPKFESVYDAQLPESMYEARDGVQFKECNAQLKDALDKDPDLREKFDEEQLEQIENLETPDGYTWHHDAEAGKMQLVDEEIHEKTGHTGGRKIWGGGTDKR